MFYTTATSSCRSVHSSWSEKKMSINVLNATVRYKYVLKRCILRHIKLVQVFNQQESMQLSSRTVDHVPVIYLFGVPLIFANVKQVTCRCILFEKWTMPVHFSKEKMLII